MNRSVFKAAVFISVPLLLVGCGGTKSVSNPVPPPVTVREVAIIAVPRAISVSGVLEAGIEVELGFEVGGRIKEMPLHEGQAVRQGQVLATLDATDLKHALAIAEAKLGEIEAEHGRLSRLYAKGSLTRHDFGRIESALAEARANAEILRDQVAHTVLRSTLDGIVSHRRVEKGTVVAPGLPVVAIIAVDHIKAAVAVPESDISAVALGQEAEVEIPALGGQLFSGRVEGIQPVAAVLSRTFKVTIGLDNPEGVLRPGTVALARIRVDGEAQSATVPGQAILTTPEGSPFVYLMQGDGTSVSRRPVAVGGLQGIEVIVTEGLDAGDLVVVGGQHRLSDGSVVSVVTETP